MSRAKLSTFDFLNSAAKEKAKERRLKMMTEEKKMGVT